MRVLVIGKRNVASLRLLEALAGAREVLGLVESGPRRVARRRAG